MNIICNYLFTSSIVYDQDFFNLLRSEKRNFNFFLDYYDFILDFFDEDNNKRDVINSYLIKDKDKDFNIFFIFNRQIETLMKQDCIDKCFIFFLKENPYNSLINILSNKENKQYILEFLMEYDKEQIDDIYIKIISSFKKVGLSFSDLEKEFSDFLINLNRKKRENLFKFILKTFEDDISLDSKTILGVKLEDYLKTIDYIKINRKEKNPIVIIEKDFDLQSNKGVSLGV